MEKTIIKFKLKDGNKLEVVLDGDIDYAIFNLDSMYSTNGCFDFEGFTFTINDIEVHTLQDSQEYLEYNVLNGKLELVNEHNVNESSKQLEKLLAVVKDNLKN